MTPSPGMRDALRMAGVAPSKRKPGESADRARTRRNKESLERGIHPITRRALSDNGQTCGGCKHHFSHRHNKTWHKCDLNATRGPATDIRVSWPACVLFEPAAQEIPAGPGLA